MQHLTREQILARKTGRGVSTLADGSTVAVRALTRDEALEMQELEGTAARDNFVISKGMTDPVLSVADVEAWAAAGAAGDLATISKDIAVLSGFAEGAGKSGPS